MDAVVQFILDKGGWGAWFLTVLFFGYWLLRGKLLHIRWHENRIGDLVKHHDERIEDYKDSLNAERHENEWLRDALLASTEMGAILSKSKTSLSGRRLSDEAE